MALRTSSLVVNKSCAIELICGCAGLQIMFELNWITHALPSKISNIPNRSCRRHGLWRMWQIGIQLLWLPRQVENNEHEHLTNNELTSNWKSGLVCSIKGCGAKATTGCQHNVFCGLCFPGHKRNSQDDMQTSIIGIAADLQHTHYAAMRSSTKVTKSSKVLWHCPPVVWWCVCLMSICNL